MWLSKDSMDIGDFFVKPKNSCTVIWHDLRKNPDDLPKNCSRVLLCVDGKDHCIGTYKAARKSGI